MPNLHDTQLGQKFFMKDMPELIKGINRLADVLEKQSKERETIAVNEKVQTKSVKEHIEDILREMCFGNTREWSENMIEKIIDTTVIQKNCIEDNLIPDKELIISALMEITYNLE